MRDGGVGRESDRERNYLKGRTEDFPPFDGFGFVWARFVDLMTSSMCLYDKKLTTWTTTGITIMSVGRTYDRREAFRCSRR